MRSGHHLLRTASSPECAAFGWRIFFLISPDAILLAMKRKLVAALGMIVLAALWLSPTGCYLSRGAWEEGKILARRQPIAELVSDPRVEPIARRKLQIVLAARAYAKDSIRLRAKDSFTVSLRPSDAFSTLGWFNDPLLSTSLRRDSIDLVNTVIHELTHNTFYAPSNVAFNESFASFVGARGAAAFFCSRGQPLAAARVESEWQDEKILGAFWSALTHTLDSAYKAHPTDREARLAVRDTVYARARTILVSDVAPQLRTVSPRYAERVPLDNASLLARRVYAKNLDLFDAVYAREGGDLKRTIGRIIALAKSSPKDPYGALRGWLGPPFTAGADTSTVHDR